MQVHMPLPLPRACLPGLLWAPGPGLGTCAGAGHERGERGAEGAYGNGAQTCRPHCRSCLGRAALRAKSVLTGGFPRQREANSARGLERVPGMPTTSGPPGIALTPRPRNFRTSPHPHPVLRPRWCTCAHAPTCSPREEGSARPSRAELPGL